MLQFSLRSLLIAMAAIAVGTAALLSANSWWSALLWGVALAMLVFAGLMVLFRRGVSQAFWGGFLLAGTLYLLLLVRSVPDAAGYQGYVPLTYGNLITTKVLVSGYSLFPASRTSQWLPAAGTGTGGMSAGGMSGGMGMGGGMGGGMMGGMTGMQMNPNPAYLDHESFTAIGHALWTLFLSWLGGTVAFWIFSTRDKRTAGGTEPARTTP